MSPGHPESSPKLDELYRGFDKQQLVPLRTQIGDLIPLQPTPRARAHLWRWGSCFRWRSVPSVSLSRFLVALVDDIAVRRARQADRSAMLVVGAEESDGTWQIAGCGRPRVVRGRLVDVAGWLTGRTNTGVRADKVNLPDLPRWL